MENEVLQYFAPPPVDLPLIIEAVGISYPSPNYHLKRKNSIQGVFEYVVKGKGTLIVEKEKYTPCAGDVYILPQGSSHEYYSNPDDPWAKIWINVNGYLPRQLLEAYRLEDTILVRNCPLYELFNNGVAELRANPGTVHYRGATIIMAIICAIHEHIYPIRSGKTINQPIRQMLRLIESNIYAPALTLEAICRSCKLSKAQAIRIFRHNLNCTPYQYLLLRKIDTAKDLLANTDKTVQNIATLLGFADEYYFSNIFKKKIGAAPRHYREEHRRS